MQAAGATEAAPIQARAGPGSAVEALDPWAEALAEAIAQFGGQAKEAEIGSWLRRRRPELANAASDLSARIRETLRSNHRFTSAGKRGVWRLGRRSSTVAPGADQSAPR